MIQIHISAKIRYRKRASTVANALELLTYVETNYSLFSNGFTKIDS